MPALHHWRDIAWWNLRGRPAPPPHAVKQRVVRHYGHRFRLQVFLETGTYLGDMVEAVRGEFREIYSIELSHALCQQARARFAGDDHVHLLEGDSAEILPAVLARISEPALFWLDGHFSSGVTARGPLDYPVLKELEHIREHPVRGHVVLVDDARLFSGESGAPTRAQVVEGLRSIDPGYTITERDDIIRACRDATVARP